MILMKLFLKVFMILNIAEAKKIDIQIPDGKSLLVWLSHDVDWVKKDFIHSVYYFLYQKRVYHLKTLFSRKNTYWNFNTIMELETCYNAKSTFFFLNESMKPDLKKLNSFFISRGRYNIGDTHIVRMIKEIDREGWEIGVHGSYNSYMNETLLTREKSTLEQIVGHEIKGIRQHYLNLKIPVTWQIQKRIGFVYDSSFMMKKNYGLKESIIQPFKPLNDNFTVFPISIMDCFFDNKTRDFKTMTQLINDLIKQCIDKKSVLTIVWHLRTINKSEFPFLYKCYEYMLDYLYKINAKFILPMDLLYE